MKFTLTKSISGMDVSVQADTLEDAKAALANAIDRLKDRDDGKIEGKHFVYNGVMGYALFNDRKEWVGGDDLEDNMEEAFKEQKRRGGIVHVAEVRQVVPIPAR